MVRTHVKPTHDVGVKVRDAQSQAVLKAIIQHEPPNDVELNRVFTLVGLGNGVDSGIEDLLGEALLVVTDLVQEVSLLDHPRELTLLPYRALQSFKKH